MKKRNFFRLISVLWVLIFMLSANVSEAATLSNNADVKAKIEQFLEILNKKTPTLKDYQWVMGYSDFAEMQMFWKHCLTDVDSAPLRDTKCFSELVKNWTNKKKSPSYYLMWLKKLFPIKQKIVIVSAKPVNLKNNFIGVELTVKLNNTLVTFWGQSREVSGNKFGNIQVISVNGVPINILREQESEAYILVAMGMRNMIRPPTNSERKELQSIYDAQCEINPECASQLKQEKIEQVLHDKVVYQTQQLTEKFQEWCNKNKQLCKKELKLKQKSNDEMLLIKNDCELIPLKCEVKVTSWYNKNKHLKSTFCVEHELECDKMNEIRSKQEKTKRLFCKKYPDKCVNEKLDIFNQILNQLQNRD